MALVIRGKYAASTCHMCLKELPTGHSAVAVAPELLRGAQQYKMYCSPACASADKQAAQTAPVHGRLDQVAAAAEVQLCSRAETSTYMHPCTKVAWDACHVPPLIRLVRNHRVVAAGHAFSGLG